MRALTGDQTFAASADDEATQRLAELTALGFQSVDVRTLPPCAGSQVIDRDGSAFRTCPRESQVILLTSGTRDAEIGRADSATVSALIIFRDPGGSVSYEFTLDAHRTNGRWLITRVKPGLIVE